MICKTVVGCRFVDVNPRIDDVVTCIHTRGHTRTSDGERDVFVVHNILYTISLLNSPFCIPFIDSNFWFSFRFLFDLEPSMANRIIHQ